MKKTFIALFTLFLVIIHSNEARSEIWETYRAGSDMFTVNFPAPPKISSYKLRTSPLSVVHYDEMKLTEAIEGTNKKRYYIVRLDQSLTIFDYNGHSELYESSDRIVSNYCDYYKSKGGIVNKIEKGNLKGGFTRKMAFTVPGKNGKTGIRVYLLLIGMTRVQMTVIAPVENIDDYKTAQFFSQFVMLPEKLADVGDLSNDWKEFYMDDQKNISFLLPEGIPPYTEQPTQIQKQGVRSSITIPFYDPVFDIRFTFGAYLYDYPKSRIQEMIFQDIIYKNHLGASVRAIRGITAGPFKGAKYVRLMEPSPQFPEINYRMVKAYYINSYKGSNYVIVLEYVGPKEYSTLPIVETLMGSLNIEKIAKAKGSYYTSQ